MDCLFTPSCTLLFLGEKCQSNGVNFELSPKGQKLPAVCRTMAQFFLTKAFSNKVAIKSLIS